MPGTCEHCGGDVTTKDDRGWFRDICDDCLDAWEHTSHREQCDGADCPVCADGERERRDPEH